MSASIIESLCKNDIFIVPIPPQDGKPTKAPVVSGWNKPRSAINPSGYTNNFSDVSGLRGHNFGIYHAASNTVAFDIDDLAATVALFGEVGLPIEDWLFGSDRLQIVSPKQNRAKLLFRLPEQVDSVRLHQYCVPGTKSVMFELRCGNCQDVIVGKHPDGGSYSLVGDVSRIPAIPDALLDMLLHWDVWVSCFNPPVSDPEPINGTKKSVSGSVDPRASFNDLYSLDAVLLRNGYQRRGKRYLRPGSSTSVPGVRVYHDPDGITRCSSAGGDILNDGHTHDAFSCYCLLECGGDFKVALAWNPDITAENQKAFIASRPGRVVHPAYSEDVPLSAYEFDANSTYGYIYDHDGDRPGFKYDPVEYEAIKSVDRKAREVRAPEDFDLFAFTINEEQHVELKENKKPATYFMGDFGALGNCIVIFAAPSSGKTLITLRLIVDSVKKGIVDPTKILYINADDNPQGHIEKLDILSPFGIRMIIPGFNGFNSEKLKDYMKKQTIAGKADGVILILDTLKKFADTMDKTKSSAFNSVAREFVSAGGTVVALSHVNKHRGADGRSISAGTSDTGDDFDIEYVLEEGSDSSDGCRHVVFHKKKNRANPDRDSEAYSFKKNGTYHNYQELFDSVTHLDDRELYLAKESLSVASVFEKHKEIILTITELIRAGIHNKTELVEAAHKESFISRANICKILDELTGNNFNSGKRWRTERGEKNTKSYFLLSDYKTDRESYARKSSYFDD